MSIVIDNPTFEAQIHAFATSRGMAVDEAIIEAIQFRVQAETQSDGFKLTPEITATK